MPARRHSRRPTVNQPTAVLRPRGTTRALTERHCRHRGDRVRNRRHRGSRHCPRRFIEQPLLSQNRQPGKSSMSSSHSRNITTIAFIALASVGSIARGVEPAPAAQVLHRAVEIDGLDIFHREAGPENTPTIVLLHGFPTSSHMFRNLIPALADTYHVVAPDYPGYLNNSALDDVKPSGAAPQPSVAGTRSVVTRRRPPRFPGGTAPRRPSTPSAPSRVPASAPVWLRRPLLQFPETRDRLSLRPRSGPCPLAERT